MSEHNENITPGNGSAENDGSQGASQNGSQNGSQGASKGSSKGASQGKSQDGSPGPSQSGSQSDPHSDSPGDWMKSIFKSFQRSVLSFMHKVLLFVRSDRRARIALRSLSIALVLLLLASVPLYMAPALQHSWGTSRAECRVDSTLLKNRAIQRQISATRNEISRLERRLASFIPTQTYLVINTVDNRFTLYRNRKLVREGFCSSGSYTLLKTEDGEKEWIFKTPRGRFTIQGKITHPVWRKPDWAFVEEGLPIPSQTDASRYEYGVLGDYAMSLGDGYLIHGTLYKRLLGMPVTHGCIRLNDDDLEAVFYALSVGSKVYIY